MMRPHWLRVLALVLTLAAPTVARAQMIVAHRGASRDAPENTLAAFELAWERGADIIEGDFFLTKDGKIVCTHDKDTKRLAGVEGKVAEMTLAELQKLDVGSWKDEKFASERMPTLEQVLATVPAGKVLLIEVKCGPEIVPELGRVLKSAGLAPEQTHVIAFDAELIAAVKKQLPELKAFWLTGFKKDDEGRWSPGIDSILTTLKRIGADGLDCNAHASLDEAFVKTLRDAGHAFHVWTVDDPKTARRFQNLGVDSITTNRPAWLREQLE